MPPRNANARAGGIDRRTFLRTGAVLAGGTVATGSASGRQGSSKYDEVHEGGSARVGDGTVTAYATTNSGGEFSALGVHVDGDVLASVGAEGAGSDEADVQGAGSDGAHSHGAGAHEAVAAHLSFPDEVDTRQFTFMGFHFNPAGHPPPEVYTVPHFDFHFYTMAQDAVEAIPLGVATYDVPDEQTPPGYASGDPRLIEPEMGEHLLDSTAPEFGEGSFTHTNVYGVYDPSIDPENPADEAEIAMGGETRTVPVFEGDGEARLHFVEPMVTTEFLADLTRGIAVDVATPEAFPVGDRYPTEYVLKPDGDGGVHVLVDDFERFPGTGQ